MNKILYTITIAVVVAISLVAPAANASLISRADSAYNESNYREALSLYREAASTQGTSSELLYNIGNTQFRLGNIGQAVLSYERALRIDPSNKEARTNLDFVKRTITGLPDDGSTFLSNLHNGIMAKASPDGWAWIAFALFTLTLSCAALYMFSSNVMARKFGFFGGFVVLILFIYTSVIAWQASHAIDDHETVVVTAPNARLTTTPGKSNKDTSSKSVAVPEGTCLQVVDSVSTNDDPLSPMWYNIRLSNSTEAWISSSEVERV